MKRLTTIATACVLAALAVLATRVGAQESNTNERTFMTFSGPVELPGVTLEAGEYEFRLADIPSRNVVQVLRKDGRDPLGQWTFVEADRPKVSSDTVVMFKETKEGTTPAVQYWYFPNEKIGKEFVYPKNQAEKIAARTGQTVRSAEGPITATASSASSVEDRRAAAEPSDTRSEPAQVASANEVAPQNADEADEIARLNADEAARQNAVASAQPSAPAGSTAGNRGITAQPSADSAAAQPASDEPNPQVAARAEPAPRPVGTSGSAREEAQAGSAGAPRQVARANELPRTASPLPLSGLIGLLSLAGAAGMRALRRS